MPALLPNIINVKRSDAPAVTENPTPQGTMIVNVDGDDEAKQPASAIPSEIPAPAASSSIESVLAIATGKANPASEALGDAANSPKSPSGGDSKPDSKPTQAAAPEDESTSAGTKAGIAFGVIGAAMLIGWLIFFFFGRRKKSHRKKRSVDTEKHAGRKPHDKSRDKRHDKHHDKPAVVRSLASDVVADKRPVTTFFSRRPGVNKPLPPVDAVAAPPAAALPPSRQGANDGAWDRPSTSHSTDSANPFGTYAERVPSPETPPMLSRSPSPILVNQALPRGYSPEHFEPAAAVAPLAPLARKTSLRKDAVSRLDLALPQPPKMAVVPGSPAPTEYSMTSVAPSMIAPGTGAPGLPASTVHRVQQDFEPSMEDEMELKAGQLVRLLHEFDDGWALCSRLDMTQQGVVPRTCISTRPLKPRSKSDARSASPPSSRKQT